MCPITTIYEVSTIAEPPTLLVKTQCKISNLSNPLLRHRLSSNILDQYKQK